MKRLFIASKINLDSNFTLLYQQLRQKTRFDYISWVEADNLHLTLRFIGKTPEQKIEPLIRGLTPIFEQKDTMKLELNRIGLFGSRYKPTVVWLGFQHNTALCTLFEKVEQALKDVGFEPNYGNFVPHLTLGRIRKIDNKKRFNILIQELQPTFSQFCKIDEWNLYQSKLTPEGPIYSVLKTWKLNKV